MRAQRPGVGSNGTLSSNLFVNGRTFGRGRQDIRQSMCTAQCRPRSRRASRFIAFSAGDHHRPSISSRSQRRCFSSEGEITRATVSPASETTVAPPAEPGLPSDTARVLGRVLGREAAPSPAASRAAPPVSASTSKPLSTSSSMSISPSPSASSGRSARSKSRAATPVRVVRRARWRAIALSASRASTQSTVSASGSISLSPSPSPACCGGLRETRG